MVYGTRAKFLGNFQVKDIPCPYCEQVENQNMSIFGRYAHIMWIPFFPIGKTPVAECTRCKRTYDSGEFSDKMHMIGRELGSRVKSPKWMWSGVFIIAGFILISTIIDKTRTIDPREELLNADMRVMVTETDESIDAVSYQLDQVMTAVVSDEMKPQDFSFISKVRGDKSLTLVQIPELSNLERSERPQIVEMVEAIVSENEKTADTQQYIGIVNAAGQCILTKTPEEGLQDYSLSSSNPIYEFYGPAKPE
ncbi:hypothetical protein FUA23_15080 [Neolewinella aurantiaca]|uniref:Zinc-ribbon 15 domain-containing protein n=1 Tax=Neolewinella aurantiaca TaxID=2602767 RepID=A0A5C7FS67_9BACT|nr:hypothetical protein [Neolewinella aurantiaca]TXF88301.1 hypothetical protein FUA23_15080 [Neolewinella aurantiaca]